MENSPKAQRYFILVATFLALALGAMSIFAGSKVLLNLDTKPYHILTWLVIYNVVFGAISLLVAWLIWKGKPIFKTAVYFVLFSHVFVFLYLNFISSTTASESIKAMLFRASVWVLIMVLSIVIPKAFLKSN